MSSGPGHVAPRHDEGDKDRRITYSRESLLSVRRAALEADRDSKLLAGIDVCKNEVGAALMSEPEPRVRRSKTCTRFFSAADCRFGDACRFLHHFPSSQDEQAVVTKKMNNLNLGQGDPAPARAPCGSTTPTTVKTRLCKNHGTPEGCKWGDKCHFAHGDSELGKPMGTGSSFRTRLCVSFVTGGSCTFGRRCHFAHGKDELRSSDALQ